MRRRTRRSILTHSTDWWVITWWVSGSKPSSLFPRFPLFRNSKRENAVGTNRDLKTRDNERRWWNQETLDHVTPENLESREKSYKQEQSRKDTRQRSTEEPVMVNGALDSSERLAVKTLQPGKSGSLSKVWRRWFEGTQISFTWATAL